MTGHEHRAHATLAPSSAHRWTQCPGSIRMSSGVVDEGSAYARLGTAAHELAEKSIRGHFDADRFLHEMIMVQGEAFVVDADMVAAVQVYLDVVYQIEQESDEFETEQRMDLTNMVPGCFGTGDVIAYREDLQRVTIADYKHGMGVAVDPEDNEQLLTYAAGVASRYHNRGIKEVELIVVQPRSPHAGGSVRRWTTDIITLYEHVANLQRAAIAVEDKNAPLVAGEWCRFCKAAGFCGALENKVKEIMGTEQPEAKPLQDWKIEQAELNLVAQWLKGREAFAHSEAVAGRVAPGAKLVAKRAFRKWTDAGKAAIALNNAGLDLDDLFEPPALKSPAVIEKLLPKAKKAILKELARAESSGTVIAPLSDPRPAVDINDARGFEAVEIEERQ